MVTACHIRARYLSEMVLIVRPELRQQNRADNRADLPLPMLQRSGMPLAAPRVFPRVEIFVPAYQLLHILQEILYKSTVKKINESYPIERSCRGKIPNSLWLAQFSVNPCKRSHKNEMRVQQN